MKHVSLDMIDFIIDHYQDTDFDTQRLIKGLWYAYDPIAKTWIAVDNSTSSAFTEEFSTKEEAIKWLQNP